MHTLFLSGAVLLLALHGAVLAEEPSVDGFAVYKDQLIKAGIYRVDTPRAGESLEDSEKRVLRSAVERFRTRMLSIHSGPPAETEKTLLAEPEKLQSLVELSRQELRNPDIQEMLVTAGALNEEPGEATLDEIEKAVLAFRAAIRAANIEPGVGRLTQAEKDLLTAAKESIDKFAGFEERDSPSKRPAKDKIVLPLALVEDVPDGDGSDGSWTTYRGKDRNGLSIDHFATRLKSFTPISLANRLLEVRKDLEFERLELTGDAFRIDAFARSRVSDERQFVSFRGRELSGYVVGFGIRGPNEPPSNLAIPKVLVTKPANLVASEGQSKLTPDVENWRSVVRIVRNLLGARQAKLEYFERIARKDCSGTRLIPGNAGKVVRMIYATGRKPLSKLVPGPVDLAKLYGAGQDSLLHMGCLEIELKKPKAVGAIKPIQNRVVRPALTARLVAVYGSYDLTLPLQIALRRDGGPRLEKRTTLHTDERALLFIHGYNNGFHDAVESAARIAAEKFRKGLNDEEQLYLFSWPSTQNWVNYAPDMDFAEQAEVHLSAFMKAILSSGRILGLDVVAHSMGSQILLRTIDSLRSKFDRRLDIGEKVSLGQVIFAAPDVSSLVFVQKIIPFTQFAERVTLYASANDGVLDVSGRVRLGVPRAGFINGKMPIAAQGVHVIDVTRDKRPGYLASRAVCGPYHSAFINDPSVLQDIAEVLNDGLDASRQRVRYPDTRGKVDVPGNLKFLKADYEGLPPNWKPPTFWRLRADYGKEGVDVSRFQRLLGDLCMR